MPIGYQYAVTDQLMNHGISDARLQELFNEQEKGYGKSRLLAEGKQQDGVDVLEEIDMEGLPKVRRVSLSSLERVYGKDAVAHALGKPLKTSGYGEGDDYRMTGESVFHEGLGFVISEQPEFNSAALGMEKHMLLSAACAVNDEDLNHQAKALAGILMDHGWGPEFFAKNKLTVKLVGIEGDPRRNAASLARHMRPTFAFLQQYFPGTVSVVAFDAPHRVYVGGFVK